MAIEREILTIDQAKPVIKYVFNTFMKVMRGMPAPGQKVGNRAYIDQKLSHVYVLFRSAAANTTYKFEFYLDDRKEDELPVAETLTAFQTFGKYYNLDKTIGNPWGFTVRIMNYANTKHKRVWHKNCWCYDVNKAYAYSFLGDFPDTTVPWHRGIVGEGEIGFNYGFGTDIELAEKGDLAEFIFPAIRPEGVKRWIERYTRKEEDPIETKKNKEMINFVSGQLQNWNIFWRAALVNRARKHVEKYFDENTVFGNTDSIVSLTCRTDIPISESIGDFKVEHFGDFCYLSEGAYQWKNDALGKNKISIKGRSKQSVNSGDYDLLETNFNRLRRNAYYIDWNKGEIVKYGEENNTLPKHNEEEQPIQA